MCLFTVYNTFYYYAMLIFGTITINSLKLAKGERFVRRLLILSSDKSDIFVPA